MGPADAGLFERAEGVFDHTVSPGVPAEYLATPGHRLVVALAGGEVVGQAAALLHRHPDDRPVELAIDERALTGSTTLIGAAVASEGSQTLGRTPSARCSGVAPGPGRDRI
jgi:hypothetical protein